MLVTKRRVEIELDEEQLARLDWLCRRTGKTRQELLQEGVRWVFRTNDGPWDLDDPLEQAALDWLQARAVAEFDRTDPWPSGGE
ncbi:MAG TPA: ribbon-helix-helix domain-containing protein [Egibacteraceae bacterium]|nr:ribbon-helix-helix domain-containing protein [Egibacteraceae bacterium]